MRFEDTFFTYLANVMRIMKVQPLNLGGYTSSSGGAGGPPGGFIGYLPQNRVTYDTSEASTLYTPPSGATLVDNLNHIRYWIDDIANFAGITVEKSGAIVGSGITVVDFLDNFGVSLVSPNEVSIAFTVSGQWMTSLSGVFTEDLTAQVPAVSDHYYTVNQFEPGSLEVYYNGTRQNYDHYVVDTDYKGFTFPAAGGNELFVDYWTRVSGVASHFHGDYVTRSELQSLYYNKVETNALLAVKANIIHTHVEADITDLEHDAIKIQGVPVSGIPPINGQGLLYNSSLGMYVPHDIASSVQQQIIFTVDGAIDTDAEGAKLLRIYSHDVGTFATISEVYCSVGLPPIVPVQIDVRKNNVTIFNYPQYVEIPSGAYTAVRDTGFLTDTFVKNDYFQITVVQGDAGGRASDLTVHIRFSN